ncbi:unnamed protein product [Rhizophagus irregularis]|nr:unnamed protein product [Rhizophagus irregularis]CAB4494957.1 unnamed protein product [Rhizophagus irregularis]CAB5143810.1 unnamed protein product [Rhizophagus irregularis]CAB5394781.1 unnamed protein product [Rhizophagus irregularis]
MQKSRDIRLINGTPFEVWPSLPPTNNNDILNKEEYRKFLVKHLSEISSTDEFFQVMLNSCPLNLLLEEHP